jgi:PAP_fibrillin
MDAKAKLLELIAGRNRGLLTTETDRVRILGAIEQVEDQNPYPNPLEAKHLLAGNWRLLFTSSRSILGLDRLPFFQLGQIYQYLDIATAKLYNIAEIVGVPWLEGAVIVSATFEPVSERRVVVKFERSIFGLQRFLNYRSPQEFIEAIERGKKFPPLDFSFDNREQKGWLDITYLDDDLRIGRGNEGSVFILAKEKN